MRADRLIQIIMLLQTRGKLTADTLANELEVSRRTILRDVDSLSISGVPIYTDGGHGGGITLDNSYRNRLTGLKDWEALTLLVADNSRVLSTLGLSQDSARSVLKLLATLPTSQRTTIEHMRQRILIDPDWWFHETISPKFWDDLYYAVFENQMLHITYLNYHGDLSERILEPYSLVSKSSNWYLVAQREGVFRVYRVSRIHDLSLLETKFERRPDFDFLTFWKAHSESFAQSQDSYDFVLAVRPEQMAFIRTLLPGRTQVDDDTSNDKWLTVKFQVESERFARMLIFELGDNAKIVEPDNLRVDMLERTIHLVDHLHST